MRTGSKQRFLPEILIIEENHKLTQEWEQCFPKIKIKKNYHNLEQETYLLPDPG